MNTILVVLAAGLARRFGRLKQLDPVGPDGECLLDFGIFDARRAGFRRVVLVVRAEIEAEIEANLDRFFPGADTRLVVQQTDRPTTSRLRRTRPWGTAHAVLAAAPEIDGPFAVMNADDFYGRRSFDLLASCLRGLVGHRAEGVIIGFPLEGTLSDHGGVSRAVCERNPDGTLKQIVEHVNVQFTTDSGIVGTVAGQARVMEAGALVSMNLWGFTPAVMPLLAAGFDSFLSEWSGDEEAEYMLPHVVGEAVQAGRLRIEVVSSPEEWFGMTFAEDRDRVSSLVGALLAAGEYPRALGATPTD